MITTMLLLLSVSFVSTCASFHSLLASTLTWSFLFACRAVPKNVCVQHVFPTRSAFSMLGFSVSVGVYAAPRTSRPRPADRTRKAYIQKRSVPHGGDNFSRFSIWFRRSGFCTYEVLKETTDRRISGKPKATFGPKALWPPLPQNLRAGIALVRRNGSMSSACE